MLLVLGRPGSGCTSLLKVLSNHREEFDAVHGDVSYGNIDHRKARHFRNQIVMSTEEDAHFPTLKVSETLDFAVSTKLPKTRPTHLTDEDLYIDHVTGGITDSLAISHTKQTIVGNEFVRGVSGGERRRVSIAEVLTMGVCSL